jgi:hypothetical protein
MAGQTLGPRAFYQYTNDAATNYSLLLDETTAEAAGLTKNDTFPNKPLKFKPRGVYIEATIDGNKVRKFLVCQANSPLYNKNVTSEVTIEGEVFDTTGRRGESLSFPRNAAEPPPP